MTMMTMSPAIKRNQRRAKSVKHVVRKNPLPRKTRKRNVRRMSRVMKRNNSLILMNTPVVVKVRRVVIITVKNQKDINTKLKRSNNNNNKMTLHLLKRSANSLTWKTSMLSTQTIIIKILLHIKCLLNMFVPSCKRKILKLQAAN